MRGMMIAVLAGAAGFAGGQNLLGNAGFESDILFDTPNPMGNWNAFFGDFGGGMTVLESTVSTDMPFSGTQSYRGTVTGGAGAAFTGIEQEVSVVGGGLYEFSFWAKALAGSNGNVTEFRIEWEDADGNDIGDFLANTEAAALTDEYQQFSQQRVAPENAAIGVVVVAIQSFGGDVPANQVSFVDDAAFVLIPAPGSALAFAGAGLLARRRRA